MGVPAFYRWISEKYPKIVVDMLEMRNNVIDGVVIPLNLSEPNPNGFAFLFSRYISLEVTFKLKNRI
jgi:5'-3' exoribonuclease 2